MKHIFLLLIIALLALSACHTNVANYRESYEKAVERTREKLGDEAYRNLEAERIRYTALVGNDSVRLIYDHLNFTPAEGDQRSPADVLKQYLVIVGEFKQLFNARSYCERLKQNDGYDAFVVFKNSEQEYCVVIEAFDELDVAAAFIRNLPKNCKTKIVTPRTWILSQP